jgi:hypothetical protein
LLGERGRLPDRNSPSQHFSFVRDGWSPKYEHDASHRLAMYEAFGGTDFSLCVWYPRIALHALKSLCEYVASLQFVAFASRGICRTYGARNFTLPCTQCFRTGLRSFAPPALSRDSPQPTNHKSPILSYNPHTQIDRDKARALQARQNVAQPGRAGNGGNHNSEHR